MSRNRKHVTEQVLHGFPEPKENESIVRVTATRGTNQLEVEYPNRVKTLAMIPMKFNKLVWTKRGDYVIISTSHVSNRGKIKGLVKHVLFERHIKHLQEIGVWPVEFVEKVPTVTAQSLPPHVDQEEDRKMGSTSDEEEESSEEDEIYVNPNRVSYFEEDDSSSSDEGE